jgi:hypothetical protein
MREKVFSRKFALTLGAVLVAVGSAVTGETTWNQAVWATVASVLGYVGIEGARDIRIARPYEPRAVPDVVIRD